MGRKIGVDQEETFFRALSGGLSIARSAQLAGFSVTYGKELLKKPRNGREVRELREAKEVPQTPVPLAEVCAEARAALEDRTGYLFVLRYWGVELSPWQQESWEIMEDHWDSPDREFVLENGAPGAGKSLKVVAFGGKRIVLNRAVRLLYISRAQSLAERNTMRLRRALERVTPAAGAEATLAGDFGRFKPLQGGEIWARHQYVVEQMDGTPIEEKEPTVAAFGFDSDWLGNRLDGVFGDDLDTTRSIRSFEVVEKNRDVFDNELEPRLDAPRPGGGRSDLTDAPAGGLFLLTQQRLGATDFSAHALSKTYVVDDDGDGGVVEAVQYKHVIFKAHYEDRCAHLDAAGRKAMHVPSAPAYPEGCLLEPVRLPYRDLIKAMNNPARFKLVYQQEEADPEGVLVKPSWVRGGKDPETGEDHPGCWDEDRGLCELPAGLTPPLLSVVTVDPSVANFWAFQWWVVHPESGQRFLMDAVRQRMTAGLLLDWLVDEGRWVGIMEEWQLRSEQVSLALGQNVRISTWVLEAVGAFKFLTAFDHSKRWRRVRGVSFVAHETHINKHHTSFGVTSIAPHWQFGRVRLPGRQGNPGRVAAMKLVDEVTRYRTDGTPTGTDDQVDANWMLEWNLPALLNTLPKAPRVQARPGHVRSSFGRHLTAVR